MAATHSIKLTPGFSTEPGARFSAKVYADGNLSLYSPMYSNCSYVSGAGGNPGGRVAETNNIYQAVYEEVDTTSIVYPHITIDIEVDSTILDSASNNGARMKLRAPRILKIDTVRTMPSVRVMDDKANWLDAIGIAPNPTSGIIQFYGIDFSHTPAVVDVLNLNGQKLISVTLTGNSKTLDLSGLPNGYILA